MIVDVVVVVVFNPRCMMFLRELHQHRNSAPFVSPPKAAEIFLPRLSEMASGRVHMAQDFDRDGRKLAQRGTDYWNTYPLYYYYLHNLFLNEDNITRNAL